MFSENYSQDCVIYNETGIDISQQWHIIINFITKTKHNRTSSAGMFVFVGINH